MSDLAPLAEKLGVPLLTFILGGGSLIGLRWVDRRANGHGNGRSGSSELNIQIQTETRVLVGALTDAVASLNRTASATTEGIRAMLTQFEAHQEATARYQEEGREAIAKITGTITPLVDAMAPDVAQTRLLTGQIHERIMLPPNDRPRRERKGR